MTEEAGVREDWEQRIYRRADERTGDQPELPAPAGLAAVPGAGHVRLSWDPVPGAAGYVIERAEAGANGASWTVLRHGGSDVPAVPGPPFADTGLADGSTYCYRVGAIPGAEYPVRSWSEQVRSHTSGASGGHLDVAVDTTSVQGKLSRVWQMVGTERLSQLRLGHRDLADADPLAGSQIAAEFSGALRLARAELGVRMVRAHAILHDDNHVVARAADGSLRFDFSEVDAIYDELLATGLRPVVELSFMPAALASDPSSTVFTYRGIICPPSDWAQWRELVRALAGHLAGRYGLDEVRQWPFEVWNEPNLEVFWTGTQRDYLRLYDESASAIKSVDDRLLVGGPATAAAEWIEPLAAHSAQTGVPVDFVSTHTYGNLPLDVRASLSRHGLEPVPVWWTEWGAGSTHFGPVHDSVIGAPFVLSGYHSAQHRVDAVAYWVLSDHFEELGRPQRLFHNGFGLLTVGNLRKPRYWAAYLASQLGDQVLASTVTGDGAGVLVQAWAARHEGCDDDGTIDVLVWNGTVNAALMAGDPRLDRTVTVAISGLADDTYQASLARVDEHHSNIVAHCPPEVIWPDDELWARLRSSDELHTERLADVTPQNGTVRFPLELPMPGIARIRLSAGPKAPRHERGETQ